MRDLLSILLYGNSSISACLRKQDRPADLIPVEVDYSPTAAALI